MFELRYKKDASIGKFPAREKDRRPGTQAKMLSHFDLSGNFLHTAPVLNDRTTA